MDQSTRRDATERSATASIADTRCSGCSVGSLCIARGSDEDTLVRLDAMLETRKFIPPEKLVIRKGDPFKGLVAVRAGCFKSYTIDRDGREQVQGFYFPGELIGMDAVDSKRYRTNVVSLDDASLCSLDYEQLLSVAACSDGLQRQLFRLFSNKLAHLDWRTGDFTSEERIAAFLLDISLRLSQRGGNGVVFELLMSRSDIGNHLSLATETVSRVFSRLRQRQLIAVSRKRVEIRDHDGLNEIATSILDA